jgi:2-methylcitrate dehydratase PrpD
MTEKPLTHALAAFAHGIHRDEISAKALHAARRSMLDFCGVALAGSRHPGTLALRRTLDRGAPGTSILIGMGQTCDPFTAAQINGFAAHVFDWDDTILPARAHFGATLLPAIFAESAHHDWSLGEALTALAAGFEISARLSTALYPAIHDNRWHTTAVIGPVGVAAALGRLLGADVPQIAHGMGLAANGAGGLMSSFGTSAKALNVGRAASWGLLSAHLGRDMKTHDETLDAGGFIRCFADGSSVAGIADGLGRPWSIERNGFKPYPCGFVAHPAIDAVRDLRTAAGDRSVERIMLEVAPVALDLMGCQVPATELEAKFSLSYVAAIAWIEGNVTPSAFEDSAIASPAVRGLTGRLEVLSTPSLGQEEARAEAVFTDGSRRSATVFAARGSSGRPLSDYDLAAKFRAAVRHSRIADVEGLADTILSAEHDVPLSTVTRRLRGHDDC